MLTKTQRRLYTKKIIDYFEAERDEQIGIITAEDMLNFFLEEIAKDIYNKGIEDSRKIIQERLNLTTIVEARNIIWTKV